MLFIWIIIIPEIIVAQYFTIDDIEFGRVTYLKPANIQNLQWLKKSDSLCYIRNDSLFARTAYQQKEILLLTLSELNELMQKNKLSSIGQFPEIVSLSENQFYFNLNNNLVLIDIHVKDLVTIPIPEQAENLIIEPHTTTIAYTLGQNVFIRERDKDVVQLSTDTLDGILNGTVVCRHEFGMEEGMFWSPKGTFIAFYKKREKQVTQYPLVNIEGRIARTENIRYPMAGMVSEETEIWVYSVISGSLINLAITGEPDSYHTNLCWSPDEQLIYVQHLNRDQDTMILRCYSVVTGEMQKEIFTETHKKYVEPMNPLVFSEKIPGNFLYQSERDGYNHIYYYESSTNKLKQVTKGDWEVTQLLGFDESERFVFFMATKESPLERHFYKYDMLAKTIIRLTPDIGTHEVIMNAQKTFFIDTYSSTTVPRSVRIINSNGLAVAELLNAPNPLNGYTLGKVTTGTIMAGDGKTSLYYRITWPVDFDSTKKYPVILYVYGGPHVQLISESWLLRTDYLHQYYAQHGIASFELDSRGSEYRGRDFEDIIHRQLGIPQIEDQYEGIKFLEKQQWVDTSRIGIEGWSFGGFMTVSMMEHFPEIFKVGVAGGVVTDWKFYEVMYGERYMDRPEQNPEGYKQTDVNLMADKLQGKLLLIHGALDNVVVWQNSLVFLQECINNGKQVEYFVYPLEEHNVLGRERKHLTEMTTQYFLKNL